jgi:ribosomal protein S18 acetylase RimI-like enzyme
MPLKKVNDANMNDYIFSLAKPTEIDEILDFYHSLIGTPGCTWSLDYPDKEILESDIKSESLYTLRDKDNILVSVAAAVISDELDELHWSTKNPCDLARIGVLSSKQNQGIGTLMLCNIINAAKSRGFDGIRMLVSRNNPSALALYNKNGFHKCGETLMYGIDFFCYEMVF